MRERTTTQMTHTIDLPSFLQADIKESGKVYTPFIIVDDIITRYTSILSNTQKICDPSMGQGNFLCKLFDTYLNIGYSPNQAFTNLYGFDIDQTAILKAQTFFIERGVDRAMVASQILCLNPITELFNWVGIFDIVIGNPPYVRSPKNIPSTYTLTLNLIDVFFEIGIELLKVGGTLIYITQDSFFTNEDSGVREYLSHHNIKTAETRFDYSKIFRQYNVAVDICLVEIQKGISQCNNINVWRHQPFTVPATCFKPNSKWFVYPERISNLNTKLQLYDQALSSVVTIKKGRTENNTGGIPAAYNSTNYSKIQTPECNIPVIGEPNLNYFFPTSLTNYKNFTKLVKQPTTVINFEPFIALPYFTSKFRFCLIEEDILTTPLVYTFIAQDIKWLLPLLNSSVTDFQIRYNTKSRDTAYEFKKSTFDIIKFPNISTDTKTKLISLVESIRNNQITQTESDDWVCKNIYMLSDDDIALIKESQSYWFKKHVKSIKVIPTI